MKFLPTLALAATLTGVASAATVVQTKNYSFVPTGNAPLTFNKFDTSLGTLTAVTITTNVTKSGGSLSVDNESATPASGTISQTVSITLSGSGVVLLDGSFAAIGNNLSAVSSYAATVGADDGDGPGIHTTGSDYATSGTFATTPTTTETKNVNSIFFAGYSGSGTYGITANGSQGLDTSAIGGAAGSFDPATVFGDVVVTYTYTAIPEPSSILLGGVGMLALLRRRRR